MTTDQARATVSPEEARLQAHAAAQRAGVQVTALRERTELGQAQALADQVWGPAKVLPADILQAVTFAGETLLVATPLSGGDPVGFAFGFLGWDPVLHLHSHMTAVLPGWRSTGVGYALKLAQRHRCLRQGVRQIRWTFDPLVAANAAFNLLRLGAHATRFLPDFYGPMGDKVNGSDISDRLEVTWVVDQQTGGQSYSGGGPELIEVDENGCPHRAQTPAAPGTVMAVPHDYVGLRAAGDPRSEKWRRVTGEVLADIYDANLALGTFGLDGYLVDHVRAPR